MWIARWKPYIPPEGPDTRAVILLEPSFLEQSLGGACWLELERDFLDPCSNGKHSSSRASRIWLVYYPLQGILARASCHVNINIPVDTTY